MPARRKGGTKKRTHDGAAIKAQAGQEVEGLADGVAEALRGMLLYMQRLS